MFLTDSVFLTDSRVSIMSIWSVLVVFVVIVAFLSLYSSAIYRFSHSIQTAVVDVFLVR